MQAQDPEHTLQRLTTQEPPARLKKQTIFRNNNYTTNIDTPRDTTTQETIKTNSAQIYTQIVTNHMQTIPHNKILNRTPPEISIAEQALPHYTRRLLAQLRTNKSPIVHEYLHKITPETHPTPNCPLCHSQPHDTRHIFGCRRTWAPRRNGTILGGGGAASPLVVSAGVGPGAGMRGEGPCRFPLGSTATTEFLEGRAPPFVPKGISSAMRDFIILVLILKCLMVSFFET